jgi:hypothetical protein
VDDLSGQYRKNQSKVQDNFFFNTHESYHLRVIFGAEFGWHFDLSSNVFI